MKAKHLLAGLSSMLFALSPSSAKDPMVFALQKKFAAAGFPTQDDEFSACYEAHSQPENSLARDTLLKHSASEISVNV